jgi:hypothetical protein
MSAAFGHTCDYGELLRFAHLRWYSTRVLGAVFAECTERGEPDLTAILVRQGGQPEDVGLAEQVWAYWRGVAD